MIPENLGDLLGLAKTGWTVEYVDVDQSGVEYRAVVDRAEWQDSVGLTLRLRPPHAFRNLFTCGAGPWTDEHDTGSIDPNALTAGVGPFLRTYGDGVITLKSKMYQICFRPAFPTPSKG